MKIQELFENNLPDIEKEILFKKHDIDELNDKIRIINAPFYMDSNSIVDEFSKNNEIKVLNNKYVANTGSIYFSIKINDQEYTIRIADHQQTSYDHIKPDLKIFLDETQSDWYNRFVDFFEKHNLEPTNNMKKCKKHLELTKEIYKLKNELQSLYNQKSLLLQLEPSIEDDRIKKIMDKINNDKKLKSEWNEILKIMGATGKNQRRLFRRKVEKLL